LQPCLCPAAGQRNTRVRVIEVDLSGHFDTIRHSVLLDKIAKRIQDPQVMHLAWAVSPAARPEVAAETAKLLDTRAQFDMPDVLQSAGSLDDQFQSARPSRYLLIENFLEPEYCAQIEAEFLAFDVASARNPRSS